jgi:hypothetical protein
MMMHMVMNMKRLALIAGILLAICAAASAQFNGNGNGGAGFVSPGVQPYMGQLATRSRIPNGINIVAGWSQMSKSNHIARSNITSMAIDIPTWYIQHSTQTEHSTGGTWQARAAVEYPSGTCTSFAFGGSTALTTLPDNTDNFTDQLPITIPSGATFGIRIYLTGGPGVMPETPQNVGSYVEIQGGEDFVNGERYHAGASGGITDQTAACTAISDATSGANGFAPAAIVGPTTAPSFYLWGDSRVEGILDYYNDTSTNIGETARAVGPYFGYINGGISSMSTVNWIAGSNPHQIALSKYTTHLLSENGFNDSTTGGSASTIITNNQTAWGMFGATRVIMTTLAPKTTSTDAYQTTGNQTAASFWASTIGPYNTLVRAGVSGTLGFMDIASIATGSTSNSVWQVGTISAVYTSTCSSFVMTVSAVTSGTIHLWDQVSNAPGTQANIYQLGTGTGGTGTYGVDYATSTCSATSATTVSNAPTIDGLHEGPTLNSLYNTSGIFNHSAIHYP